MKSVKEISKELGVSKQTIFNNIKRLDIETIKKDNTSFIKNDIDVERIIPVSYTHLTLPTILRV